MEKDQLLQLLKKYESGQCDADELALLEQWYGALRAEGSAFPESGEVAELLVNDMLLEFREKLQEHRQETLLQMKRQKSRKFFFYAAAAIILLMLGTGSWYFFFRSATTSGPVTQHENIQPVKDVQPGADKAVLTLADGSVILLDSTAEGLLTMQGGTEVRQAGNGRLEYNTGNSKHAAGMYNLVTTPRGGQYHIVLPDGTHVWLNAASSIRFPTAFNGKERAVTITGEAYFEVTHVPEQPFTVAVNSMQVAVLGTHFNINAYDNEENTKVTLLEGAVRLTLPAGRGRMQNPEHANLKPGQQALVPGNKKEGNGISVIDNADLEQAIAWKNGVFKFNDVGIMDIMRQAERWYDIEVIFQGSLSQEKFRGKIARNVLLSEFLKILELNKIPLKVEGRKVIIGN